VSIEHLVLQHEPSAVPASDWLVALHLKISRPEGNGLNKFDFLKEGFACHGAFISASYLAILVFCLRYLQRMKFVLVPLFF